MAADLASWHAELQKVERQNNSHSLTTARCVAKLLDSLQSTLKEQGTPNTPTAQLAALLILLQQLAASNDDEGAELTAASLYLLAIAAPYTSEGLLRSKADDIFRILGGILPAILYAPDGTAPLKSTLTILQCVYAAIGAAAQRLARADASQIFSTLLPLLADSRPKVRRKAHEVVWAIAFNAKESQLHPYSERVAENVTGLLNTYAKEARSTGSRGARTSDKREDVLSRLNGLCAFVKGAAKRWPVSMLSQVLNVVLSLPRLQNAYLSRNAYDVLELLLDPQSSTPASADTVASALEALMALKPPPTAVIILPGWLGALETVMVALSRINPGVCGAVVASHLDGCLSFCVSSINDGEVRSKAEHAACALVRWCVPDSALAEMLATVGSALKDLKWKGRGLPHLLAIMNALVSRTRKLDKAIARSLLQPYIVELDAMRPRKNFEYREQVDEVISSAAEVGGPRWLLDIIPLNLVTADGGISPNGRAWILPVLRGHIMNTELSHFVSAMVPMCEALYNLRSSALQRGKAAEIEAKVYEALVEQIWALLPGYCDMPTDLQSSFTRKFAELLANVLYTQPNLRPVIMRSLKVLVEKNTTLAASTAPSESLRQTFGLDQVSGQANLALLAKLAPDMLAVMFNIFGKTTRENGGYVLESIATYLGILSAEDMEATYARVLDLLGKAIESEEKLGKRTSRNHAGVESPATHTMMDLLVVLTPFADRDRAVTLFETVCEWRVLFNDDATVQKKAYRVLGKLFDAPGNLSSDKLEVLISILTNAEAPPVASAAKRYRTELMARLIRLISPDQLQNISLLLPEAVLATKEANGHTREAAFDLLILMAQKMAEGGVVKRSMLSDAAGDMIDDSHASLAEFIDMVTAGLVEASPHMISASISALSRLLFDFHRELPSQTLLDLLTALNGFLRVPTREVVRSALGFWKVAVVCLENVTLEPYLTTLLNGLLMWSNDHKNHFKLKVRHIMERLMRKFGVERIEADIPIEQRKYIHNIKKSQQRAKRKKASSRAADAAEAVDSDIDIARPKAGGQSAFEDALNGSETDSNSDDEGTRSSGRPTEKTRRAYLQDSYDEPMDLLNADIRASAPSTSSRGQARTHPFKTDARGRLIFGSPETEQVDAAADATSAYVEAIEGEDGHRRDARGRVRFNKSGRKRGREEEMEHGPEDRVREVSSTRPRKQMKAAVKEHIGAHFKAKRAGGDVTKDGVSPYAYVPLSSVKHARSQSHLSITGRKAGKSHGSKGARRPRR